MKNHNNIYVLFSTFFLIFVFASSDINENYRNKENVRRKYLNKGAEKIEIPGCIPIKLWMLIRYGNKAPSIKDMFLIGKKLPKIRNLILKYNPTSSDILHDYDLRAFRKWENQLTTSDYYKLPKEYEKELTHIAERMQIRFPELLRSAYSRQVYRFKYYESKDGPNFFTIGLIGNDNSSINWYEKTSKVNPVLEVRRLCDERKENQYIPLRDLPFDKRFSRNSILERTVAEINKNLKLPKDSLSFEDIHLMHLCCLYETASNISTISPWCSTFSVHNLKVLKYLEDIKYYSEHRYSKTMNDQRSCVTFDDLIKFMESENQPQKSTIYFTNYGTILRSLLFFDRYNEEFPKRNLGITQVNPFETNLAFVLYRCHGVLKVLTLHEEHAIRLPWCPHSILCELSKLSAYYPHMCNFDVLCEKVEKTNIKAERFTMIKRNSAETTDYFLFIIPYFCLILIDI